MIGPHSMHNYWRSIHAKSLLRDWEKITQCFVLLYLGQFRFINSQYRGKHYGKTFFTPAYLLTPFSCYDVVTNL